MFRFRHTVLVLGSVLMLGLLLVTDPDSGLSTGMLLLGLGVCILAMLAAHIARKVFFDYPEADMQSLFRKAGESPSGAGMALIALAIVIAALLLLFGSRVHAMTVDPHTFIPANAKIYAPVLRDQQARFWVSHPAPETLAGLVEQESCISLIAKSCWSPTSRLKSAREEGAGLGQITRAFKADGSTRFDALADMRARHAELAQWSWANVYQRPDLQLRAIVLMGRDNYSGIHRLVADPSAAMAFSDAAYNGGMGGVQSDRRACQIKAGCNPALWFGHVELTCTKSREPLYGRRSACDINRDHVRMVLKVRSAKYRSLMEAS